MNAENSHNNSASGHVVTGRAAIYKTINSGKLSRRIVCLAVGHDVQFIDSTPYVEQVECARCGRMWQKVVRYWTERGHTS